MQTAKKTIFILYNGNHIVPMRKLKDWIANTMPEYNPELCTQTLFAWKVRRNKPHVIITYNKNLMSKSTTKSLLEYCSNGGTLIALHHNVSSMMLRRPEWLEFMEVKIEKGEQAEYPWSVIEGGDLYVMNLQPDNPITTKNVSYSSKAPAFPFSIENNRFGLTHELSPDEKEKVDAMPKIPAIKFGKSEYFINHLLMPNPKRIILLGQYFSDPASGRQFYSSNAGWTMKKGSGTLYYFMVGHSASDFNDDYCNIIKNCIENRS